MDDKNELNDLLLGNQKESSSSKKFFLVAAGVLLLFFIIIGIMKFMAPSETKQILPITAAEEMKKVPDVEAVQPAAQNANATAHPTDANMSADEKLNAIVKKLQQDAQSEATGPQPAGVTQPAPNVPVQVPVATKQATQKPQPQPQAAQVAPKTTVVSVPIKTATAAQPIAKAPKEKTKKEELKKEDVKKAFKEATKNVTKTLPRVEAKPKVAQSETKPKVAAAGTYFVQVGYFESEAAAKGLREKANSLGFGSTTKAAVKNDKNITKVWVGPFDSKEDATKALPKIRGQIKSDAFIIKG